MKNRRYLYLLVTRKNGNTYELSLPLGDHKTIVDLLRIHRSVLVEIREGSPKEYQLIIQTVRDQTEEQQMQLAQGLMPKLMIPKGNPEDAEVPYFGIQYREKEPKFISLSQVVDDYVKQENAQTAFNKLNNK